MSQNVDFYPLIQSGETIERIEWDFKGRLDEIGQAISAGDENQISNFFNQARATSGYGNP